MVRRGRRDGLIPAISPLFLACEMRPCLVAGPLGGARRYSSRVGFSLMFVRVRDGDLLDADRVGLAEFLSRAGLGLPDDSGELSRTSDGAPLAFDGRWTDLQLDDLSQEAPVTGRIDHATLGPEEAEFIFRLCVAGKMMVVNPQGSPMYIVPGDTHAREEFQDPDDAVWVRTSAEFAYVLGSSFEDFSSFRDRVLERPGPDAEGEPAR